MGGLVGSIFDLAAGNPTQGEQNQFGALSGYQTGVGEGLITPAAQYEESILSGDPTKTAQAMAPEISANQQQTQQFKNQSAEFSPRSGGTAASVANADTSGRSNLIDLLGQEQSGAASTSLSAGSGLLDSASNNLGNEANLANQWRQQQTSDINGIAQGAASIAMGLPAGGGADPYATLYSAQHPD
ncbi:MAG: hypothetical protein WBW84_18080, partial [Acidobacteriaceae bacterium]